MNEDLKETAREFVRREVLPHLDAWEDAGEVPRSLHLAAAKQGLLGLAFPEDVGGEGGTLSDSVAAQEAFFEAYRKRPVLDLSNNPVAGWADEMPAR